MLDRRMFCTGLLAAPAVLSSARSAGAETYPSRLVTIVLPYPAGGGTDSLARMFAEALGNGIGQKVIVDNRGGAAGMIGGTVVAKARPDGYTLLYTLGNLMINSYYLFKERPFHPIESFVPITQTCLLQAAIVTRADHPANNLQDFIDLARKSPGQLSFAYYGELGMLTLAKEANLDLLRVPYKGGLQGMLDVSQGRVDVIVSSVAQSLAFIQDRRLKALAITGDDRVEALPGVKTVKETLPNYQALDYHALFAPAGTPQPVVDFLYEKSVSVLTEPTLRQKFLGLGGVVNPPVQRDFREFMQKDFERIGKVIQSSGIAPE
ncbi:tripartite tricarboxylate transporter substrate binding protein [Bradyrhizobium sp. LHD-71]|uniref:Bug family tripartite tricarboxylate transporter substrate binding protein n=1 Tax=Bradyrhizobium sp. LHD-71 TaxID=3072141 RepID=UPI00280F5920|nr:tripartite tricarboxylate transporter substrate binding protein [Bradyrhizobium sp. LHD-71]MDQ8728239.1 tripartite tricarboxylate transporter substrate binding protein [Bradyrhizobium sp. LHD-71]